MNGIGGHQVKWNKPGSKTQGPHVFSHMLKIDPSNKHIHKNKHEHIHIYMQNTFIIVEGGKDKKIDSQ
jgi:hypothetical protein